VAGNLHLTYAVRTITDFKHLFGANEKMRYQYPAPNSFGHYWDEEAIRIWGVRIGVSKRAGYYLNYLLGEIIFANLYLAIQLVLNQPAVVSLSKALSSAIGRIHIGAIAKRSIDVVGALVGLVITSPIWLLAAIAVKIDSRGPVFYRQERVGKNRRAGDRRNVSVDFVERRNNADRRQKIGFGKSFMIIKFRSMTQNAESKSGPTWATKNDARVTRVGKFMRATRVDELPQLINVLMGDMSLVGPRPERPFFVSDFTTKINDYSRRFQVKPGITGLAQVEHKYDECIDDVSKKISYDLKYIRNWTVFQDLKIIMKTVIVVLTARGM
jgi:lipopolysaccharide/colanic/teichoic acid biosynthesis glycosyltransferase